MICPGQSRAFLQLQWPMCNKLRRIWATPKQSSHSMGVWGTFLLDGHKKTQGISSKTIGLRPEKMVDRSNISVPEHLPPVGEPKKSWKKFRSKTNQDFVWGYSQYLGKGSYVIVFAFDQTCLLQKKASILPSHWHFACFWVTWVLND